jgi:hypothetical protein
MTQYSYSCTNVIRNLGIAIVCVFRHYRVTKLQSRLKIWVRNLLDSEDMEIHSFCFTFLERIGGEWTAEAVLNIPSHKVYSYDEVLPLLVRIGKPALEPLKTCIETKGSLNVCMALDALVGIAGDDVFEYVFDLFKSSTDPQIRGMCVNVFRRVSSDLAVPALIYAMDNRLNDEGIGSVVLSLASIRDDRVVKPLVRALFDEDVRTNLLAVFGLGNIFNDDAVEALRQAESHGDPEIRAYARMMLCNKGKPYLTAMWSE